LVAETAKPFSLMCEIHPPQQPQPASLNTLTLAESATDAESRLKVALRKRVLNVMARLQSWVCLRMRLIFS